MTTTVQTSSEIRQQIKQVESEVRDIQNSLPKITNIQNLLGAKAELRDRAEVVTLLQERLADALKRERVQEQLDKRRALEAERDAAKEQFDRFTEDFECIFVPLERETLDQFDKLDQIAWARSEASRRYSEACFNLAGGRTTYGTANELSTAYGWRVVSENDPSGVRRALFPLYASRHKGMPGGFDDLAKGLVLKQQQDAEYDRLLNAPRSQQAYDNDFDQAIADEVSSYFDRPES